MIKCSISHRQQLILFDAPFYKAAEHYDLIFAPGETQKQVRIPIVGDTVIERDETFLLRLPRAYGVRVSDASSATATIVNDDSG